MELTESRSTGPGTGACESVEAPDTVYGVDFSAAATDAGEKTWIAEVDASGADVVVEDCSPAVSYLGCEPEREPTMEALVAFVRELDADTAVGFDFPFGVPGFLLDREGLDGWQEFIGWFPDGMDDPEEFSDWGSEAAREHTGGDRAHIGRRTDEETGGKCPYGFIARYPAFHGMRDVLGPLVETGDVIVVPTMSHAPGRPLVLETYPAAVLDGRGLCRENYKGGDRSERTRRERNLDGLVDYLGEVPGNIRERIIVDEGGDGLDALAAATATHEHTRDPGHLGTDEDEYLLEARIYA